MEHKGEFIIHTDGGARGNPGPAAWAVILQRPGQPDVEEAGTLGETTNNIAEYTALVHALELAQKHGGQRLRILSDSELIVRQMQGRYKVKNEGLLPLFRKASELVASFEHVAFEHIPRKDNKRADRLCNEVLDGESDSDSPRSTRVSGGRPPQDDDLPVSAKNPALDLDLTRLVRAWPYLSSSLRTAMLELLDDGA